VAIGVVPNVSLAAEAGLDLGPQGAILVNQHMQTSDMDIYAAGDCVEVRNLISEEACMHLTETWRTWRAVWPGRMP
jgi:NAD(P)H-nitrite reductase large subunit